MRDINHAKQKTVQLKGTRGTYNYTIFENQVSFILILSIAVALSRMCTIGNNKELDNKRHIYVKDFRILEQITN